jgi:hypothetical protein
MEFQDPGLKQSTSAKLRADDDGARSTDDEVSRAQDGASARRHHQLVTSPKLIVSVQDLETP